MKPLLVSKHLVGLVIILLLVQMACIASSISPTATPGAAGPGSTHSTQPAATQPSTGPQSTQAVPTTGGQAAQSIPSTGGRATSPADAQALLGQVARHYQSAGRAQALKDFTDKNPPFNTPEMFVMCLGSDHQITALGGSPLLVGVSADSLSQVAGQSIGSLIWDAATLQPEGSVQFQWKNPLTSATESKVLYYQKLSQDVCGVVANRQ